MECRCYEVEDMFGDEAAEYVATHLHPDPDDEGFVCPDTGRRWRLDDSDPDQTRLVQV